MNKRFDIVTLGAININLALRPVDKTMFDRDVTRIPDFGMTPGGDAMNEALAAVNLGNSVAICGKIGNDAFGESIKRILEANGVNSEGLVISDKDRTAVGTQLIDENGQRNIVVFRGAIESFCFEDVNLDVVKSARYLSIGSLNIMKNLDGPDMAKILRIAKESGVITCADTMSDTYGWGFDYIKPCMQYIDYLLPSYEEAVSMTGEREPQRIADAFMKLGCAHVIIKMGTEGCFVVDENVSRQIPVCPAKAVDTTGAGDNFVGGYITGIKNGMDIVEAARFASAVAAISIQEMGSSGAIKSMNQVLQFRKEKNY